MKKFITRLGLLILASAFFLPCSSCTKGSKPEIAGADRNQNGIRDDVEVFIDKQYPEIKQNLAARRFARGLQESLLSDDSRAMEVERILGKSLDCLFETFGERSNDERLRIRSQVLNTGPRNRAYLNFNVQLSGKFVGGAQLNPCDSTP